MTSLRQNDVEVDNGKLGIDELELGKFYRFSELEDELLEILEIDKNSKARGTSYRVWWESYNTGDCNIPTITSPWSSVTSLEGRYVWTASPSFNGDWDINFTGPGGCSATDATRHRVFIITGGGLTPFSDNDWPASGEMGVGVCVSLTTSDGGVTYTGGGGGC